MPTVNTATQVLMLKAEAPAAEAASLSSSRGKLLLLLQAVLLALSLEQNLLPWGACSAVAVAEESCS
jgi:hypothetical protein